MPVSGPSPARLAPVRLAPVRLIACVLITAAALTSAGCRRNPPEPPRAARAQPESSIDAGAPVLAAALNARAAIAAGDALAAYNDTNTGLRYAVGLAGADSALYPPPSAPPGYSSPSSDQGGQGGAGGRGGGRRRRGGGPAAPAGGDAAQPAPAQEPASSPAAAAAPGGHGGHRGHGGQGTQASGGDHGGHAGQGRAGGGPAGPDAAQAADAPFTAFDAQVRLVSALAKLQAHDPAGADVDLQAIADAVHPQQTPAYLPLIRASQSLALASAAVSRGRLSELRTQLTSAQTALEAYQGGPHAAEAKALAAAIDEAVRQPGGLATLPPAQIALWAGVVGAWT